MVELVDVMRSSWSCAD